MKILIDLVDNFIKYAGQDYELKSDRAIIKFNNQEILHDLCLNESTALITDVQNFNFEPNRYKYQEGIIHDIFTESN